MHSQVKKKIVKKHMWPPACQLFSSGEGAPSWLEQMRVKEGLQELELTVPMAPADTNTVPP